MFVGADAFSLAPMTNRITYLEDGDWAILSDNSLDIFDADGKSVTSYPSGALLVCLYGAGAFMAKEIFEQPEAISHTFA